MILQEILVVTPSEEGQQTHEINLNLDRVHLIVKKPLEPIYSIIMDSVVLQTATKIPDETLLASGMVDFGGSEGITIFANPKTFLFMGRVELGQYFLAYPGGHQIMVSMDEKGLKEKLGAEEAARIIV